MDLDGTLVDIGVSFFVTTMVESMVGYFEEVVAADTFRDGLTAAIDEVMAAPSSDGETNRHGFYRAFGDVSGLSPSAAEERFRSYYEKVFPALSPVGAAVEGAAMLVEKAAGSGFKLALATNPIFPRSAILTRMRWGGISEEAFAMITDLDIMRSCKPHREYFLEVAETLDAPPERCLMVGNDLEHDMSAASAGMRTYLVDRYLVRRGGGRYPPDARGDLRQLGHLLEIW